VVLYIPIKLGARTYLYDIAFEGNQLVVEEELRELAELELGAPLAQADIDKARRRLLDAYAEQGLAFAEVDALLDLSSDHTRARIRFIVNEREPVRVSRIVVRGAKRTSERLIRSRIALRQGDLFRRSLVRKTEERLATLGVFSTVTVALQDPTVPAREKVVEVTVQERPLQYLDVRPGFSTGDGFRITFEYGHRNLASEAIQLTLRSQLGLLPTVFIFEEDVRRNYEKLDLDQRLERRNSATLELPEIGLGPLFRLSLELVDVRDNARDFGLTKDAAIVTVAYRPDPRFSAQVGVSLERNDPDIFSREPLREFIQRNPTLANRFRVPDAVTVALAERIGVTWDRRDSPLDATKGTFVSAGVEHVRASPIGDIDPATQATDPFAATESQFLRFTNRVAGYIRLSETGLALATSFRWGWNKQLRDGSRTYPDRLFFLGGVDSLRGFLQDALVPEDIARELLRGTFSLNEVVIRGGDVFINPRAELRIPVSASVQTAVFVDTGNLWSAPERLDNAFALRYSAGSGIRIVTPIGPLVFDYGFNIERVLDDIFPDRTRQRFWEDLGAFHFSIGVF
jgi:outer membrane protein assembly factor BamA